MDLFTIFLVFCISFIIWWDTRERRRSTRFPPGPPRLPIIGSLLSIAFKSSIPSIAFAKLAKIYGDVMYVKMGSLDAVVFSSHEAANEIFNHDKANDRVTAGFVADRNMDQNMGIIWGNGEIWQTLRRFTIRTLRDFGFGKAASMDVVINEELTKFLEHFSNKLNQKTEDIMVISKEFLDLSVLNVLWRLVTGKSFELGNDRLEHLLLLSNEFIRGSKNGGDISLTFPVLRDWFPGWTGRTRQRECIKRLCDFCREAVNEHRQSDSYATDPQSFIDVFLAKIDQNENKSIFNDEQLIYTLLDLLQAGADTSSNTLTFALVYLTLHPDKQEKVHKELDAAFPSDDVITVAMKSKLPYCTATLLETQRYSSVLPFAPNRETIEDIKVKNYIIKKGTAIIINLQAMHFNEGVWGDPHVFRPERFLTKDGAIDKRKAELVVGFGGGRRVCLGQNLAESTMLIYFTTFFEYFKLERVTGGNGKLAPSTVPVLGLVYSPRPFEAKIICRG